MLFFLQNHMVTADIEGRLGLKLETAIIGALYKDAFVDEKTNAWSCLMYNSLCFKRGLGFMQAM